jgi:hypothetical protein
VLFLEHADGGPAQLDPGNKAFFGLIGIGPGQTLRLAVVNAGTTAPPEPDAVCRVRLGFADLDGQPLRDSVELRLLPGAARFVDLPYASLAGAAASKCIRSRTSPEGNRAGRSARSTSSPR